MARRRHVPVTRLREELTCPQCDYSLRGQAGAVVTCPECGMGCDVTKLIMRDWIGPWYRAPGFKQILRPLLWPGVGVWVVLVASGFEMNAQGTWPPRLPVGSMTIAVVVLAGWGWSLWRARRVMSGNRGLWLSALAHVLLVASIGAVFGTLGFLGHALFSGSMAGVLTNLLWLVPLAGILYLCRRGERFIAERCIRNYLMQAAAPDTMSTP